MKLNDVRVLRNIIGDKIDENDHDEFLERKLPTMTMKKLDLKKMPRKDIYGRNLDTSDPDSFANPDNRKENIEMLTGKEYKEYKEVNPRNIDVSSQKEKEEAYKKDLDRRKDIRKLEDEERTYHYEQENKDKEREIKRRQLEIIAGIMKPKPKPQTTMPVTINGNQVKAFGVGLRIPTREGVNKFFNQYSNAASPRLTELSLNAGGALVGEFGEEASTRALQKSLATKQGYMQYLKAKYEKKGYRVNNESDLMKVANDKERARLQTLSTGIQTSQRNVASTGFMSGSSGRAMISGTRQHSTNMNILAMTQIGNRETPRSSFESENFGRAGVNLMLPQPTGKLTPENKWGVLFDQPSSISTDKLTRIIGKGPSPLPGQEAKLDKYMKKFNSNEFKDKVKRLL